MNLLYLIIFISVFVHEFRRTVGQELILLDDNVTHRPHSTEVTELDQGEVRAVHQDVIQLDIEVTEVL